MLSPPHPSKSSRTYVSDEGDLRHLRPTCSGFLQSWIRSSSRRLEGDYRMPTASAASPAVRAMTDPKYTGTKEFLRAYALLIEAAQQRRTVVYGDIAKI